ncbi:MAG TPA: TylF/MycF/NovP-related O-methyltransferase [Bryobacteraceae bacterium]|nr:TylF/MycF/NovP-related O-methyltransferase [Bryobacteraceae bacterium]
MKSSQVQFPRYSLLDDQLRFLEGWFRDTLPGAPMRQISVLRLDADMYASTMDALESIYLKLTAGGHCIIDDYGAVPACKQAVNDFRGKHAVQASLRRIDWTGVSWQKEE